ncbi:MAG: hypothetical protein C5B53_07735 [Candidatus Melainabacteria bacterium]|nr:MAG: hypothetical protein C5B53_07735 [Candidatus Melainabacteria bacterium]
MPVQISQPPLPLERATPFTGLPVPKLDALTSLRFFAAAMIVWHHAAPTLSINQCHAEDMLPLAQGVSFFFVLSGFILTYVYGGLRGTREIGKFLQARFARLWPGHLVATLLALCVIPLKIGGIPLFQCLVVNLLMVQTWTMGVSYWPSINPVAWSISTEFFFYFCFIALIRPWRTGWVGKFILAALALLASMLAAQRGSISLLGWQFPLSEPLLLYLGPTGRTLEFVLGMGIATAWLKWRSAIDLNRWVATTLEIFAIAMVIWGLSSLGSILPGICPDKTFQPLSYWLMRCGCAPLFGVLIFVMALRAGYISRVLEAPILVWLGEISYSVYLLHFLLLGHIYSNRQNLDGLDVWAILLLYLLLLVVLSDLNFSLVETPFRKWLRGSSRDSKNVPSRSKVWSFNLRSCCLGLELVLATLLIYTISCTKVTFSMNDLGVPRSTQFGKKISLDKGLLGRATTGGARLILNWRSMVEQRLVYQVAVQVVDREGKILAQEDYRLNGHLAEAEERWADTIYIAAYKLRGASAIGIALVNPVTRELLPVDRGPRDWQNLRLLIPLEQQPSH